MRVYPVVHQPYLAISSVHSMWRTGDSPFFMFLSYVCLELTPLSSFRGSMAPNHMLSVDVPGACTI
jgi:hypothetical protein